MKCFYDPSQDAIGTCKCCGRGLSADHLTDLGKGLACRGRCEEDVRSLVTLIHRNVSSSAATNQILKRSSLTAYGSGVFLTVTGLIFTFTGLRERRLDSTLFLGIGFLAYGVWTLFVRTGMPLSLPNCPTPTETANENPSTTHGGGWSGWPLERLVHSHPLRSCAPARGRPAIFPAPMNKRADWFAWALQFLVGLVVGALFSVLFIHGGGRRLPLIPLETAPTFVLGAALIGAALASYYGDQLWIGDSYRVGPSPLKNGHLRPPAPTAIL